MKIIVDALGGDNAPVDILKGCELAKKEYPDIDITLVGDTHTIKQAAFLNSLEIDDMTIVQADDIIGAEDDATEIRKSKSSSSMAVGLKLLKQDQGEAFVSAGNTGALVIGASSVIRRIKGIKRAALAPIMPSDKGCYMLLDAGANLECRPEMLMQFGIMGSIYIDKIMSVQNPKVGLVNVGTEKTKGTDLYLSSYELLSHSPINFIGNVEARDIPFGACDVVVADGFTGNIVLKLVEGMGSFFSKELKGIFEFSPRTKLSAMLVMNQIKEFKKKMDYSEYGGAPLMGIEKPVIKAHGSSNAIAFKNAIRQAINFVEKDVIEEIKLSIAELDSKVNFE